ncbi:MAG: zf-HC2 domain-containing protein [Candidatus Sulfotelmatobacter sp.]
MVNGANTNHEAVNCEQVWREISNYVDGEVDAELRSAMEEHFRTCKRCASVLAGTRNVVQLYGDERMLEVPAGFSQRLENRLGRLEKSTDSSGSRWSSLSAWLVPLAAIALFTGALALVDQLSFKPPEKSILAEPGRDIPPDMLVVVSDGSKVFHVAGCPFIHDKATERTITAKQAMHDGYVPCSRCLRQYLKASATGQQDDDDASADAEEERGEVVSAAAH